MFCPSLVCCGVGPSKGVTPARITTTNHEAQGPRAAGTSYVCMGRALRGVVGLIRRWSRPPGVDLNREKQKTYFASPKLRRANHDF
jgi:hypothetical protein